METSQKNPIRRLIDCINDFFHMQWANYKPLATTEINDSNYENYLFDTKCLFALQKKYNFNLQHVTKRLCDYIQKHLSNIIANAVITAPGILSFDIKDSAIIHSLTQLLDFAENPLCWKKIPASVKTVDIEVISANPTGFLHIGHLRNGVIGRALGGIFHKSGYSIHWSYLVNDGGEQVKKLANSVIREIKKQSGFINNHDAISSELYHTEEVALCAKALLKKLVKKTGTNTYDFAKKFALGIELSRQERCTIEQLAVTFMKEQIVQDLHFFHYDDYAPISFFSEKKNILSSNTTPLEILARQLNDSRHLIFNENNATWLKTSKFGDEKDRVLLKSNGTSTYFLLDLIYHIHRVNANYDQYINIWGSDHHGYIARIKAGLQMTYRQSITNWSFYLIQMLKIASSNNVLKMSKRFGTSITLEHIFQTAPTRFANQKEQLFNYITFFLLEKSANVPIILRLDDPIAFTTKSNYIYIQYCYVRIIRIIRKVKASLAEIVMNDIDSVPKLPTIMGRIIMSIVRFPEVIAIAQRNLNPSKIVVHLVNFAKHLHFFYEHYSVIHEPNKQLQKMFTIFLVVVKRHFDEVFQILNLRNMNNLLI